MSWLAFIFAVELGVAYESLTVPPTFVDGHGFFVVESGGKYDLGWVLYTELSGGAILWDLLYVMGDVKTYEVPIIKDFAFAPFRADYGFKLYAQRRGLSAGYEHRCIHPIWSPNIDGSQQIHGGSDRFYFRAEVKR